MALCKWKKYYVDEKQYIDYRGPHESKDDGKYELYPNIIILDGSIKPSGEMTRAYGFSSLGRHIGWYAGNRGYIRIDSVEPDRISGDYRCMTYSVPSIKSYSTKGLYIEDVVAGQDAYPRDGESGSYWYVYQGLANKAPTISGMANEDLGEKNIPFNITYCVNDADSTDALNIVEKLNGVQINSISNAPREQEFIFSITKEILNSLELNKKNTVQISVTDGKATVYKTVTFTKTNIPPEINSENTNLGTLDIVPPILNFTINDAECDTNMTLKINLDGALIDTMTKVSNANSYYNMTLDKWLTIPNGNHVISCIIEDSTGGANSLDFTFKKLETVIQSDGLTDIIPTDALATKIMLIAIIDGTTNIDIENSYFNVCNNAFDKEPTWENAINKALAGEPYIFNNKTKTNEKAGIDIKFKIARKAETNENIEFYGLGGAFE